MNHLRILFWVAIASPLLALWPQGTDATDWQKEVERATTSTRYGLRLAAARKVAAGGAAAVPALRDFARQRGKDALPLALVEAIADQSTTDAPVVDLLGEWAADREFFWRAQALRGLARRAPELPARKEQLLALFTTHRDDPAWLARTHARLGLHQLGAADVLALPESDPRARTRLHALLLQHGTVPPLQPLLDALLDERTFLGDPWGSRSAKEAHQALKAWLGAEHPVQDGQSFEDKASAVQALLAAAGKKSGQRLAMPSRSTDPAAVFVGGLEILSCKHGDQFVQWTADGALHFGVDAAVSVQLPAEAWSRLSKERAALQLAANLGVVICDSMRLLWQDPKVHVKVAPGALPAQPTNWLKQLAQALEEAGQPRLAETLRTGLAQFAAP